MSDEILTTNEELSMEDQKKAINLQDLVYIKKYIDDNHYDKNETDTILETSITTKVESEVATKVADTCYSKDEIDANHYTKTEIDNSRYTKTETDETFYKRTDEVANAAFATSALSAETAGSCDRAVYAETAVTVPGALPVGFAFDVNGVLTCGDIVIPYKKLLWEGSAMPTGASVLVDLTNGEIQTGDTIEVEWLVDDTASERQMVARVISRGLIGYDAISSLSFPFVAVDHNYNGADAITIECHYLSTTRLEFLRIFKADGTVATQVPIIKKIWKIVQ